MREGSVDRNRTVPRFRTLTWPRFWMVAFAVWAFMFIVLVRLSIEIVAVIW